MGYDFHTLFVANLIVSPSSYIAVRRKREPTATKDKTMYLSIVLERRRARRSPKRGHGHSLPMLHLAPTVRNNLVAMLGEFVGTFLFLFEKQRSTFLASLGIGIAFFLTELSGTFIPFPFPTSDYQLKKR